jgi:EmrB/QacA subfamily drug resistance transporter
VTLTAAQKRITLVAAVMGSFVALLDATVVNVALPAIRADLGGGLAGQQWVVNAFLLMLGSLLLVGGSLGDVVGARRVFAAGAGGFGAASVLCAAAPSIELLVAGRALQGAFGALLTPASLALIVAAFSGSERGAAIGTWTAYSGIAAVVGPLAGGALVDALDWRWIFALNVPFVLLTLALTARMPALSRGAGGRRPDWPGAALCAAGLAGPTFGLVQQPEHGWGSAMVALPIAAGFALLAAFVAWERHARDPMLPLGLFARGNFAWGNVETLAMYGGLGALSFLLVVFLQQVGGLDAFEAGLALLPSTVLMFLLSRRFGALADRYGPRAFMGVGPLVCAAGALLLVATVDERPSLVGDVLPGATVFALGLAIAVAPLTAAILGDADESNAGIASGVNNAVARVASLLATAAIGAVAGGTLDLDGFRMGLAFAAALLALGGAIGLLRVRNPRREVRAEECPGGQLAGQPKPAWCPEEERYAAAATDGARTAAGAGGGAISR